MTHDEARRVAVEAAAKAAWASFVSWQTHPEDWDSWGSLIAMGHQGMHRVNEFRGYAQAAITAYESAMAAAGWRMGRDVGEAPTGSPWDRDVWHRQGWNACRAAMLREAE